jgi:hypothetical protein
MKLHYLHSVGVRQRLWYFEVQEYIANRKPLIPLIPRFFSTDCANE